MKKILLSAAAVAAFTSAAVAADLPSRRAPPVYVPPPAPVFTWSGPYAGFNVGAAFNDYTDYGFIGGTPGQAAAVAVGERTAFIDTRPSLGFAGGGQIGYNFQIDGGGLFGSTVGALGSGLSPIFGSYGGVVFGVEADIDALTSPSTRQYFGSITAQDSIFHSRTDFVGTARGRLGYAFGNLLLYGTGGFAYASVHDNATFLNPAGVTAFTGGVNRIQTGYAYGGGVEYAIPTASFLNFFRSSAVTVKAEFIHYDLGANNMIVASGTGTFYNYRVHNDGNIARLGVNYKFGTLVPTAPVVARY